MAQTKLRFADRHISSIIGHHTTKVLDNIVKCKFCQACANWSSKQNTSEYEVWAANHADNCEVNHEGSSGKMEVNAIYEIFARSEQQYRMKYTSYVGDGDSKTRKVIVDSAPYGDTEIRNKECVGRVQKRIGTRLRNCKKNTKELGGKGKLTDNLIDKLTIVYYGLAIRRNNDSVNQMKEAIMTPFFHMNSSDQEPQHDGCPSGSDSWCSWQRTKAKNILNSYHHKPALHPDVAKAIEPIFRDLSSDNLLQRCVGGFTLNANESLNNVIWRIVPKISHNGVKIVNITANIATCTFNYGAKSYLEVLDTLGIKVGRNADRQCEIEDADRIAKAKKQTYSATREGRIQRRQSKIAAEDAASAAEGLLYGPGIAD